MKPSCEPGRPTANDIERLEQINVPAIYLDWNVFQYLQTLKAAEPLLEVVMDPDVRTAMLVPHSVAHLLDATAVWTAATPSQRVERLRKMVFADGVTRSTLWEISGRGDDQRHNLRPESLWEGVRSRLLAMTREDLGSVGAEQLAELDAQVDGQLAAMRAQVEADVAAAEPERQQFARAFGDATAEALAGGVPAISDAGKLYATIMRPLLAGLPAMLERHGFDLAGFSKAHPYEAIELLDQHLTSFDPPMSFDQIVEQATATGYDPDDVAPAALGLLGYYPEDKKKVRRASPGLLPDGTHARYGLNAAVFITGDKRLAMRVEAWSHHTGRGLGHGRWPVISVVRSTDRTSFEGAGKVVSAVAAAFPTALRDLLTGE